MKKKQKEELKAKSSQELAKEISQKEAEILKLKMQVRLAQVKNTSSLKRQADELAAMKTILNEKKLTEAKQ